MPDAYRNPRRMGGYGMKGVVHMGRAILWSLSILMGLLIISLAFAAKGITLAFFFLPLGLIPLFFRRRNKS